MKKFIIIAILLTGIYTIAQPNINMVTDFPDPVEVPGYNNITADITNATQVYVEIYYPNATLMGNYSMTNIASNNWYYNASYSYPMPLGKYNYVIKAYNATGWTNSSIYNFTLQDTTPPNSIINAIVPYWNNGQIVITSTANDNYALANVSLWYRYSNDNSSWSVWKFFAKDDLSPWQWNFNFSDGSGYYQFYSIANDTAKNSESKTSADAFAGYDALPPSTIIQAFPSYENYISSSSSISLIANDTLSGINSTYYRIWNGSWNPPPGSGHGIGGNFSIYSENFSLTGNENYIEFYSDDKMGNIEAIHNVTYIIDDNGPFISCINATPSLQVVGGHVNISCCITDESKVDENSVYVHVDYPDGSYSNFKMHHKGITFYRNETYDIVGIYNFIIFAKDEIGNENSTDVYHFEIQDITPPETTYSLSPSLPNGKNGWYITDVEVTLHATDANGVAYTKYRIDNGNWQNYVQPFIISTDGNHTLEFYSVDTLGNVEPVKKAYIKIDETTPLSVIQRPRIGYLYLFDREILPLASGNTISMGRLTVKVMAYDDASGIENVSFYLDGILQNIDVMQPYEWVWSGDIGTRTLYAVAYNKAGLHETTIPIIVYIISF